MKKYHGLLLCVMLLSAVSAAAAAGEQRFRVVLLSALDTLSAEEQAAKQFLASRPGEFTVRSMPLSALPSLDETADILWIHLAEPGALQGVLKMKRQLKDVRARFESGTGVLCTGYAAMLPYELGVEKKKPAVRVDTIQNDWLWDKRGFQGFRGHPLFEGMFGGDYVWDPNVDQLLPFVGYFKSDFPAQGKVIGVDKAYVFIYSDTKVVIEHDSKKGKMLSVGSCVYFSRENQLRRNLERFLTNALGYLGGKKFETPATYWVKHDNQPKPFTVNSEPLAAADPNASRLLNDPPSSGLLLTDPSPGTQFYDMAGRRALFMGKEQGGIDELWVHPYKVFYQYQAGVVSGDTVAWLKNFPSTVEVRPESFTRIYRLPQGELREVIVSSLEKAGGIVHYECAFPAALVVSFKSDFRWMWPYDVNALGDLYYAFDKGMNALHLKDVSGDFYTLVGSDVPAVNVLAGQYDTIRYVRGRFSGVKGRANVVACAARYELTAANKFAMNLAVIGTNEGKAEAMKQYRAMLPAPERELESVVNHYRHLLASTLSIESPEQRFDTLFKWAIVGTDKFFASTPGVGTGLLAGYGTTATGWNGAQKVSGRPGYAWYFGRDAAWSSFAIDDYGNAEMVRKQLELFEHYQDASGKIFHEISTSGVVHYDASDATPLYVILAGHYLRASGDTEYLKHSWGHLKQAMDFLYSTDTDGDGLIENTNVGHGWVEGGALFGAHTEFYLAALWAQALKEMAQGASLMEEYPLSAKYGADAERVRKIVDNDFWNDSTKFYNLGKLKNGTYQTEKTVLPAVGAYFNFLDDSRVQSMLDAYASDWFSSDWGIRIVSMASPLYKPTGYHYGSIWPLFTGWGALAEYEYGNSTQGFMHIWDNLNIKNHWALGYVEEVMHGAIYKPTGICAHQCWSETNILHPAITGMVGWKPNAIENAAELEPRFPVQWDTVTVRNLKVGISVITYSMKRATNRTEYVFTLESGKPVDISFAPELPLGMTLTRAFLDGKPLAISPERKRGLLSPAVVIGLTKQITLTFEHAKGIGMHPIEPEPQPGDSSEGFRIISTRLTGNDYIVELEGRSGGTHDFLLTTFDTSILSVSNGEMIKAEKPGQAVLRVRFDRSPQRYSTKEITLHVQ